MFSALVKAYFMWVNNCANSLEPPSQQNILIKYANLSSWSREGVR